MTIHLERGQARPDAHAASAPLDGADHGHSTRDARSPAAAVGTTHLERGQEYRDAHITAAPPNGADRGQGTPDARITAAVVGAPSFDVDHPRLDAQNADVVVEDQQAPVEVGHSVRESRTQTADPAGDLLLVLADELYDIEKARIAAANRLLSLTTVKGLAVTDIASVEIEGVVLGLQQLEERTIKALERAMKQHPLGPWVKRTPGVGMKQCARLLAAIGDPLWNVTEGRPRRGPAELWQYCGHGDPERSRLRTGQPVEFSPAAKMRTRLVAMSCMKQRCRTCTEAGAVARATLSTEAADGTWTPPPPDCSCQHDGYHYRIVYDRARASWADRDVSIGHAQAHALRLVGKAVLKDLFLEARALEGS